MSKPTKFKNVECKTLYSTFVTASDAAAELPWRLYDVDNHNKLMYTDYSHAYSCENPYSDNIVPLYIDDYIVHSLHVEKHCVRVYISAN